MNAFFYIFLCGVRLEIALPSTPQTRQFNLALETILQFDDNNNAADFKLIENAQNFLGRLKNTLERKQPSRRKMGQTELTLSEFVKNAIAILQSYTDEDLKDMFIVLDDELRKFNYKGCKFFELFDSAELRKIISNNLEKLKDSSAKDQKMLLKAAQIIIQKGERNKNDFINFINSLYIKDSSDKLMTFLNDLKIYKDVSKKSIAQLKKIIRDGIRNVVFDHYSNLDVDKRRRLKIVIHTFFKTFVQNKVERINSNNKLHQHNSERFETTLQEQKRRFGIEDTNQNFCNKRHMKSQTTLQESFYRRKLTSNEDVAINFLKEYIKDRHGSFQTFRKNNNEKILIKDNLKSNMNKTEDHNVLNNKLRVSITKTGSKNKNYKQRYKNDVEKIFSVDRTPTNTITLDSRKPGDVTANHDSLKRIVCLGCVTENAKINSFLVSEPEKEPAYSTDATVSSTLDEYFFQIFNDEYTTNITPATSVDKYYMTRETEGLYFQEEDSETNLDLEEINTATNITDSRSRVTEKSVSMTQANVTTEPDVKSVIGSIVDDIQNIVNMKRKIASKSPNNVVLRSIEWTTEAPEGTIIVTYDF